jgi:hypothetical protein
MFCDERCYGGLVVVDGFVCGVGGWGAMHAICYNLAFDCCYSDLFPAWDFLVEFAANSFESCTALAFVVFCSQSHFHCKSPVSLCLKVRQFLLCEVDF